MRISPESDSEIRVDALQDWFDDYYGLSKTIGAVHWSSLYKIQRRMSDHFRSGRCFLVGDAGHVHAPAGGQGMNLSVGDAWNLAWKLGAVVRGVAKEPLLDSYEAERHVVAMKVVKGADRGFDMEAATGWLQRRINVHVLPYLVKFFASTGPARKRIFTLFSQLWIAYRDGPLVGSSGRRPNAARPGDRAPFAALAEGGSTHDLIRGVDHHAFVFGDGEDRAAVASALDEFAVRVRVHQLTDTAAREAYDVRSTGVVLIRPDGHVAFRAEPIEPGALSAYMARIYR
jgi:hypothetical protein